MSLLLKAARVDEHELYVTLQAGVLQILCAAFGARVGALCEYFRDWALRLEGERGGGGGGRLYDIILRPPVGESGEWAAISATVVGCVLYCQKKLCSMFNAAL